MSKTTSSKKRIAKNTIILYLRMLCTMFITLYSSRVILKALGQDDFGLYNVVGGVVALLSFLRTSLTSSTQRFLSFEMERNDNQRLRSIFSTSIFTHISFCFIIILLAETVGLWFLNTQLNIPAGRLQAANWIYQFSIISLCTSTITSPYNADIISHEKMGYYAFVSIVEALLKLLLAYLLLFSNGDRLIFYGALMVFISFIDLLLNWLYCYIKYQETHLLLCFDKTMFKQIFSFSGWTILGQLAIIGTNQGTGILINIFHSVAANAAMGIAQQVNSALAGLTANFQKAFQPQITKSYAAGDYIYMNSLICQTAKISFFLLFITSLPIMMNIELLLNFWLTIVPHYTATFCILYVMASLMNAVSTPLWISIFATGKIRSYQIAMSVVFFSDLAIVYLLFRFLHFPPTIAMMVKAVINMVVVFVRLWFVKRLVVFFSAKMYMRDVLLRITISSSLTLAIGFVLFEQIDSIQEAIPATATLILISIVLSLWIGFTTKERKAIYSITQKQLNRLRKK